ncbi:low molecular weight phosphotyrosine protein phosphatase [bacterium]|nr:low molecular weight phosphotyrosine protein phosphatase [bacterium]
MSKESSSIRVLFVCLGNICRSPLADGVFDSIVHEHGQSEKIFVDSAGTSGWHVGDPPDKRMRQAAAQHGVSIGHLEGRQFVKADLETFDYIFAMDKSNLDDILALDATGTLGHKVRLFREFDPEPGDYQVPDPYYGGPEGFEEVFQMVERTARMLFHRIAEEHQLSVKY